jgi:uncharacterized protein (DUF1330 family)
LALDPVTDTSSSHAYDPAMSAYVVSSYEVINRESWLGYPAPAIASIQALGGEILAADIASEALEGSAPPVTVIVKFADKAAARSWYESRDYQEVAPRRRDNTVGTLVLLDDDIAATAKALGL